MKQEAALLDDDIPFGVRGRGRPRKNVPGRNIKIVSAADLGITRRQMFEWKRKAAPLPPGLLQALPPFRDLLLGDAGEPLSGIDG